RLSSSWPATPEIPGTSCSWSSTGSTSPGASVDALGITAGFICLGQDGRQVEPHVGVVFGQGYADSREAIAKPARIELEHVADVSRPQCRSEMIADVDDHRVVNAGP